MIRFQRLLHETIKKRDNLKHYDLIVVGNLSAGYFARDFHKHTRDIYSILLVNNQVPIIIIYISLNSKSDTETTPEW